MKLADFGVAARISEGPDGDELSLSVVGTPYWMAPEVQCGARIATWCSAHAAPGNIT